MTQRAAVIGAGIAGATCARRMRDAGWDIELFDRGRGPGGRMSTRRAKTPLGEISFDHGAQYFTVREDAFSRQVRAWVAAGVAESWDARLVTLDERGGTRPFSAFAWVGRPSMSAVLKEQLGDLSVHWSAEVAEIIGEPGLWRLKLADGRERGFYHAVILATPGETAAALLHDLAPLQSSAAVRARSAPCWALMLAFDERLRPPFDAAKINGGPISWVARNASKPGRADVEAWVAHASPSWSQLHVDAAPGDVERELIEAFRKRLKASEPVFAAVHLWRHAMVERPVGSPFGWDRALSIGSCGDWYLGQRVELAWNSGDALGRMLAEEREFMDAPEHETRETVSVDAGRPRS
ncbi:MAG: NAD(P)-binding protein [Maricaulaceae bacterium]|jgi:predicted NAD/FAD-dependent oxidoreductase